MENVVNLETLNVEDVLKLTEVSTVETKALPEIPIVESQNIDVDLTVLDITEDQSDIFDISVKKPLLEITELEKNEEVPELNLSKAKRSILAYVMKLKHKKDELLSKFVEIEEFPPILEESVLNLECLNVDKIQKGLTSVEQTPQSLVEIIEIIDSAEKLDLTGAALATDKQSMEGLSFQPSKSPQSSQENSFPEIDQLRAMFSEVYDSIVNSSESPSSTTSYVSPINVEQPREYGLSISLSDFEMNALQKQAQQTSANLFKAPCLPVPFKKPKTVTFQMPEEESEVNVFQY